MYVCVRQLSLSLFSDFSVPLTPSLTSSKHFRLHTRFLMGMPSALRSTCTAFIGTNSSASMHSPTNHLDA